MNIIHVQDDIGGRYFLIPDFGIARFFRMHHQYRNLEFYIADVSLCTVNSADKAKIHFPVGIGFQF